MRRFTLTLSDHSRRLLVAALEEAGAPGELALAAMRAAKPHPKPKAERTKERSVVELGADALPGLQLALRRLATSSAHRFWHDQLLEAIDVELHRPIVDLLAELADDRPRVLSIV